MKKYTDNRRHTAVIKVKVGHTVLCRQERKNSLTHYDAVPMVVTGVTGSMITAKNCQKTRTRNSADWKLLKNGYRESVLCGESDGEDTFEPDPVPLQEVANEPGAAEWPDVDTEKEQNRATGDRPRRKITSTKDTIYKDFVCD